MTILIPLAEPDLLFSVFGEVVPLDLETGFEDTDEITLALPDYPLASITEATSYVEFTSEPDGDFDIGPTDSVAFSATTETLVAGDSELRFPRSLLDTIDLSAVTGVRFKITATAPCTFRCMGIRLLKSDQWVFPPIDLNTRFTSLMRPVPLDGSVSQASDFPTVLTEPTDWPIIFRADTPSSSADPSPIDSKVVAVFNAGSLEEALDDTTQNKLSLYFRQLGIDYVEQLDLDGLDQGELDGLPQPDFGEAQYRSRVQSDFEANNFTQTQLNNLSQFELERLNDEESAAWLEVNLRWSADDTEIDIGSTEDVVSPYEFGLPALNTNENYGLFVDLRERQIQVKLWLLDFDTIGEEIFDSTLIIDEEMIKRHAGRIGWYSELLDGDAEIKAVRPYRFNFAEYRSLPFESISPISGARLDVGATEDSQLFRGIFSGPWGGEFGDFPERGPRAFKIRNLATSPLQGFQTNPMYLGNFRDTIVSFDLLVSQAALNATSLEFFLWNGIQPISLPLNNVQGDVWSPIEIRLSDVLDDVCIPGVYSIVLVQSVVGIPNDWFIDNFSVKTTNMLWEGRAYVPDAWTLREEDWLPFSKTLNKETGGVLFRERTKHVQTRGLALKQNALIDRVNMRPNYAPMGQFTWANEEQENDLPVADFDTDIDGQSVDFTSTSTDDGFIVHHSWTLGDGTKQSGEVITHEYAEAGTYPVTLTVLDNNGGRDSTTQDVTV